MKSEYALREEMLEELYQLWLICYKAIYEREIISHSSITKTVEGTSSYNLEQRARFYRSLSKMLKTAKTESEVLEKTKKIKEQL